MKNGNYKFLMRGKYPRILLIFSLCLIPFSLFAKNALICAQETTLTIKMQNKTLKEVLDYIENNSEFIFFYYSKAIDADRKVSLNVKEKPITDVLDQLFKDTDVKYEIKDRQISLKKEGSQQRPQGKKQQKRKLIGTVTDASSGDPLIGVTIQVKGIEGMGTISNLDGNFSIDISNNTNLEFSYIGYKKQVLTVGDLGVLNVEMQSDNEVLDEVVVVGAGTQKKVSVTGSISTIEGGALKLPSSNLTSNFAGKLAGVIAVNTSGAPGAASEFHIRGIGTFGGRSTPLILMDGVEISSGDLNNIPAESIESFSILKDASATAIYGARGANGVMLITTKSGLENSKAVINVSLENSFVHPVNRVKYADGATWMELYNEAKQTRGQGLVYSQEQIDNTRSGINPYVYPDVDWYNLMFKEMTTNQRANINIQGGGPKVTYYMSLQANHDTGLLDVPRTSSFDNNINQWKYIFQNNISYKITPTTKVDLRMNAQIVNAQGPNYTTRELFNYAYQTSPVIFPAVLPAQEGDTHMRYGNRQLSGGNLYVNPYAYMSSSYKQQKWNTLNTSLNLEQKLDLITKGLKLTALINFKNFSTSSYKETITPWYYRVATEEWSATEPNMVYAELLREGTNYINQDKEVVRDSDNTFYFDVRLDYHRSFGSHNVGGMIMYMQREYSKSVLPNRNQGLSGRFTYDYLNKYLVEFNFGYNGTERLADGQRFEFFPALSLGWVPSAERFWQPVSKVVDFFKLRASYGLVGSDETGTSAGAAHLLYINNVDLAGRTFHTGWGTTEYKGPMFRSYAVEDAHWERAKKLDVGVDMRLFNQLNITFDYFREKRDRILMKRGSFPNIMGYGGASPWSNIGKVDSKGMELSVNWHHQFSKDLTADFNGNFTYTYNMYEYKDEPNYPYDWLKETGKPLSCTKGYIADGLFESQEEIDLWYDMTAAFGNKPMPGDIKYRDMTGDGKIMSDDMVIISKYGNQPRIQYGFGANVSWKKFDMGVFFTGSAKRTLMINDILPFYSENNKNGEKNLMQWIADDHWSEANPNPNAAYPRLGTLLNQMESNRAASSFWIRNGNFLRFKTFELGYSLKHVRIYVNGDNLFVWSPFKLWDPELSYDVYPLQRTIGVGARFNF